MRRRFARFARFALSALLLAGLAWMPGLTAYAAPASGQPTPAAVSQKAGQ